MIKVIGVRFRTAGKIYYFDPLEFEIKKGDHVIVETARGIEFGTVVLPPKEVEESKVIQPLKPVLRLATEKDIEQEASNRIKEKEAYRTCLEKIRKHELDMKLIDAEYTFDNNKVLFYFTADGRIDFRELVKDLAAVFKTRIELRQIGVRDETKIVGGIGICGRPLCCHTFLSDFAPVSIKMAKEQNLSLNPTKISGVCGRLMCCLNNEEETYEELNRKLPGLGDLILMDDGSKGEVHSVNVLRQTLKILVEEGDEKELKEYHVDQIKFTKKRHKNRKDAPTLEEELKELEKLERLDREESGEQHDRSSKEEKSDRNDREASGREARSGRGERDGSAKSERGEHPERNSKGSRHDRGQHQDRENQGNVQTGTEEVHHPESEQESSGEKQERRDRNRRGKNNRGDRQNRGNQGDKAPRHEGSGEPQAAEDGQTKPEKSGRNNRRRGGHHGPKHEGGQGENHEKTEHRDRQPGKNGNRNRGNRHGSQGKGQHSKPNGGSSES